MKILSQTGNYLFNYDDIVLSVNTDSPESLNGTSSAFPDGAVIATYKDPNDVYSGIDAGGSICAKDIIEAVAWYGEYSHKNLIELPKDTDKAKEAFYNGAKHCKETYEKNKDDIQDLRYNEELLSLLKSTLRLWKSKNT